MQAFIFLSKNNIWSVFHPPTFSCSSSRKCKVFQKTWIYHACQSEMWEGEGNIHFLSNKTELWEMSSSSSYFQSKMHLSLDLNECRHFVSIKGWSWQITPHTNWFSEDTAWSYNTPSSSCHFNQFTVSCASSFVILVKDTKINLGTRNVFS